MDNHDSYRPADVAVAAAIAAADRAPSVYNTRPWVVTHAPGRILLSVDTERRLDVADPEARELVMSCGAALYNIRIALRAHGRTPTVVPLPDPERPGLLAEVGVGGYVAPSELERDLAAAVGRRRTHRGPFVADIDDVRLVRELGTAASAEHATLHPLAEEPMVRSLSGLVAAAEHLHRQEWAHTEELARWVRAAGSARTVGVRAEDFPPADRTGDAEFPGRDYGRNRVRGLLEVRGQVTGTVALLTTPSDTRASHLAAGQALQRVLLTATAGGLVAAFHTQPLEEPALRAFIAERFCDGACPQMILRLGRTEEPPTR